MIEPSRSQSTDDVRITVVEQRLDESFDIGIDRADALSAYGHRYARRAVIAVNAERHPLTLRQQA